MLVFLIVFSIYNISKFKSREEKERERSYSSKNKTKKERKASHLLARTKSMHKNVAWPSGEHVSITVAERLVHPPLPGLVCAKIIDNGEQKNTVSDRNLGFVFSNLYC